MQVCLVPLLGPLVLGRNKKNASFLPFLVFHYFFFDRQREEK